MSEEAKKLKLVQITSVDVLLDNDIRITWQGFRPAGANRKSPTAYFSTIPGNGTGSTKIDLVEAGAQAPLTTTVELTLQAGEATLDGTPLQVGQPVLVPPRGTGSSASLEFTSETCSLRVCPQVGGTSMDDDNDEDGGGAEGGSPPPPPYPGGRQDN